MVGSVFVCFRHCSSFYICRFECGDIMFELTKNSPCTPNFVIQLNCFNFRFRRLGHQGYIVVRRNTIPYLGYTICLTFRIEYLRLSRVFLTVFFFLKIRDKTDMSVIVNG